MTIDNKSFTFPCSGSAYSKPHRILGDLQPGDVWKAEVLTLAGIGDYGPETSDPQMVEVWTVWQ